jgi:hypothetical protein
MTDALSLTFRKLGESLQAPGALARRLAIRELAPYAAHPNVAAALRGTAAQDEDPEVQAEAASALAGNVADQRPKERPGLDGAAFEGEGASAPDATRIIGEFLVSTAPFCREAALDGLSGLRAGGAASGLEPPVARAVAARAGEALRAASGQRASRHLAMALWELTAPRFRLPPEMVAAVLEEVAALQRPAGGPRQTPRFRPMLVTPRARKREQTAQETLAAASPGPAPFPWHRLKAARIAAVLAAVTAIGLLQMPEQPGQPAANPDVALPAAMDLVRPEAMKAVVVQGTLVRLGVSRKELHVLDEATRRPVEVRLKEDLPDNVAPGSRIRLEGTVSGSTAFGSAVIEAPVATLLSAAARHPWIGRGMRSPGPAEKGGSSK